MAMNLLTKKVTAAGAAGSATGFTEFYSTPVRIIGVDVDYHGTAPGTTDIVISCDYGSGVQRTVFTKSDTGTDALSLPRVPVVDAAGAAIAGRGEESPVLSGQCRITVNQSNAGDFIVRLLVAP